jgi:excisionase family DNA binding protein
MAGVVNHLDLQTLHAVNMQTADNANNHTSTSSTHCLNTEELGEYLGLSGRTIDRLRQTGALTYRRFGSQIRFAPEDVAAFVAQSRVLDES